MKKTEKIISLIENGYGLIQTMEHPEVNINKEELLSLMAENAELNKKMRKRFGDEIFEVENEPEEPEGGEPDNAEQADALGIKYNPQIGADKLRARIEEFKANK